MPAPGPLAGLRVLEFAGLGPLPHAGMVLADLGAEVLRVDRPGAPPVAPPGPVDRGRRSAVLDLATPDGAAAALDLAAAADVLLEGYRPGVMERLGLGPDVCLARNPRLVYGRVTGWGQDGPLAPRAGHDLTYLALTGALAAIGPAEGDPLPPLNLVADYGGGSMFLLVGVLAALVERGVSGRGQVVDAAMLDGTTSLLALTYGLLGAGRWRLERGSNLLDGGNPCYATYRCADGRHVAVAALEERFWVELVRVLDLDLTGLTSRSDPATWPLLRDRLGTAFATRPRDAWAELFAPLDACVAPVLTLDETLAHPQLGGRGTVVAGPAGAPEPGPAPRFSRTPSAVGAPPRPAGSDTLEALVDWGLAEPHVRDLLARGVAVRA
ncbi:MAG TPA: CaiB/BaiF CoA-transferase family protein [Kineosporiaceae bacterium]|jgi:alpha-methylacyl-CoA racemase|nr:CaiB/BaiF CoA-transferase family protein [Kineosporiaceae bacterium]